MGQSLSIEVVFWKGNRKFKACFPLGEDGKTFSLSLPEASGYLSGTVSPDTISLCLKAEKDLRLGSLRLHRMLPCPRDGRVFMNGYQSWTDSREHSLDESMDRLGALAVLLNPKYKFDRYGDYRFVRQPRGKGRFHGFSYMYLRSGEDIDLLASLDEDSAFTVFQYDGTKGSLVVERDCSGRELRAGQSFAAFELGRFRGSDAAAFDAWFAALGLPKPAAKPMSGWTSWYAHYENIDEATILGNLESFARESPGERIFQIDDGYETAVGDWLSVDGAKFPHGLACLAERIHERGFKAGLWLAPFAAGSNSRLVRENPEWVLRDDAGKPLWAGSNWGGFYALDIRREGLLDHLRTVFATVLDDWGFDMVKLDFLYAACMRSFPEATRGELMARGMEFLRSVVGDRLILGCGVPLASAFGRVDYCRIGCDVGLAWDEARYMRRLHRERVSTPRAIGNAVGRRQLDGRAFLNDPDVFILREAGNSLTRAQRELLFLVNSRSGSLLFTSDNVADYGENERSLFRSLDAALSGELLGLRELAGGDAIELLWKEGGGKTWAAANLCGKGLELESGLPGGEGRFRLGPYETTQRRGER